jgi:hypothetical protein
MLINGSFGMQTYQTDADSTLGALTENESWKIVEGKNKNKKQNEVPVVEAAEVGNTLSKKKTSEDKTSEAEPEVTTSIAMTVDGVKAEEKLKNSLVFYCVAQITYMATKLENFTVYLCLLGNVAVISLCWLLAEKEDIYQRSSRGCNDCRCITRAKTFH